MTEGGLYVPGDSPLHRAPVGRKLGVVAVLLVLLVGLPGPWVLAGVAGATALGYLLAGVGGRVALAQVWPLRWFVVVIVAVQLVVADAGRAGLTVGSLVVAVALAGLVTVTTRVADLLDAVTRWLAPARRVGVVPERVALVLALGIRTVPVVGRLAAEVREAQVARGLRPGPVRSAVPLAVRTVRHADALGEALAARGLDD